MINKEEDYLTNKLKQLKSALKTQNSGTTQQSFGKPLASEPVKNYFAPDQHLYDESQIRQINDNLKHSIEQQHDSNHVTFQVPKIYEKQSSNKIESVTTIRNNPISLNEYEQLLHEQNTKILQAHQQLPVEIRRPRSQEIITQMKESFERKYEPPRFVNDSSTKPTAIRQQVPYIAKSIEPFRGSAIPN